MMPKDNPIFYYAKAQWLPKYEHPLKAPGSIKKSDDKKCIKYFKITPLLYKLPPILTIWKGAFKKLNNIINIWIVWLIIYI